MGNDDGALQSSPPVKSAFSTNLFLLVTFLLIADGASLIAPFGSSQRHSTITRNAVATSFVKSSDGGDGKGGAKQQRQLSRPEKKALERANKLRKKNGMKPKTPQYKLHSKKISSLSKDTSTADDVLQAIKRAQNLHNANDLRVIENFLLEEVDESFAFGYLGSLLSRLAVAAMHMDNHELARKALERRRTEFRPSMRPMESAAIIRGLLRMHNVTDALEVLNDELCLPLEGTPLDDPTNQDLLKYRALALGSIASRHFFEGEPSMAVNACQLMANLGPLIRASGLTASDVGMPWTRIIRGAAGCESGRRDGSITACEGVNVDLPCNLVYAVLKAMATFPSDNNDHTYEALSNALVRRVLFVTGAVDMAGCPPADRGEAAFIGRSNVGKSSLVNMITNRKSLAYTSKRPGKTQQFNFFTVNDIPGREKEFRYGDVIKGDKDPDSFYIADLPGFGFAKVPQKQRDEWAAFMEEYIRTRPNLRVLFHLVDGRHGPIDEDFRIMNLVGKSLPENVQYVVVLTKADKNVKGPSAKNSGKVSRDVIKELREAMKDNGVGNVPIIVTSAETKLGRDDIWRYLSKAAEY
jgi:ribosome biogenesis GTP-binding protein YsxC/EngB